MQINPMRSCELNPFCSLIIFANIFFLYHVEVGMNTIFFFLLQIYNTASSRTAEKEEKNWSS